MSITHAQTNRYYLAHQEQTESNARSYPRRIPIAIREAYGIYVTDVEGKKYVDCLAGAGTLALGHNHPVVTEAIEQTLKDRLPLHTLDLTTPVKMSLWRSCLTACPASSGKERKFSFAVRPVPMRWKRRSKS